MALSSNSNDSGLNSLGEALAEDVILGQGSSLGTATELSDASASTDIDRCLCGT